MVCGERSDHTAGSRPAAARTVRKLNATASQPRVLWQRDLPQGLKRGAGANSAAPLPQRHPEAPERLTA
jgi:hypothetical protein